MDISKHIVNSTILVFLLMVMVSCETKDYPYFIKSNDHGVLWVANAQDNTISCIDRINDTLIGTFPAGSDPSRTAVDLDGNCWVGCRGSDQVIFVRKDGYTKALSGFNSARGVALDKQGNVWVTNSGNNTIQKINISDTTVSEMLELSVPGKYYYGALVDNNNFLWILDRLALTMIKYDTERFPDANAYEIIQMHGDIYGFTIDKKNNVWVSGSATALLYKIDAVNDAITKKYIIPDEYFGGFVSGVASDVDGNIWVSNFQSGHVLRFDIKKEKFDNFDINGINPHGLGADDMGFIYTINNASNNISKVYTLSGDVVAQYKVGSGPYTYSDLTGFIYRHVTLGLEE